MNREEAIKIIEANCSCSESKLREACAMFIPELRESEDERIIKIIKRQMCHGAATPTDEERAMVDAWLEKQKDASKAIEAVDRIDKYIDEHLANAHDMKDSNPDKKYYRGWDDALGKMAGILQDVYSNEKRKEQKAIPIPPPCWESAIQEQKPNSTEDMPYITDEHFYEREPKDSFKYKLAEYMTRCCTKKEGPYGYEYGISSESILKMAEEELLKRGVVQKPALTPERLSPKFAVGDTICRPMYCDHTVREIYVRCNDPVYVCMTDEGTESHISFSEQDKWERKEQKPVHTAKEMWKEMRLEVYAQASGNRHEPNYSDDSTKMFSLCDIDEIFEKIGNSTIGSQPAEWSEVDDAILDHIITAFHRIANGSEHYFSQDTARVFEEKLKSLRPQPKAELTLLDENIIDAAVAFVAQNDHFNYWGGIDKHTVIKALRSLRPSWKPSEEQIKALEN